MDLNLLLERNRLALMLQEKAASDEERRAYRHFARDCSGPKQAAATKSGSVKMVCGLKKPILPSEQS